MSKRNFRQLWQYRGTLAQAWMYALIASGLALAAAYRLDALSASAIPAEVAYAVVLTDRAIGFGEFLGLFLAVGAVFFILLKTLRSGALFKLLFYLVLASGWYALGASLGNASVATLCALLAPILYGKISRVTPHNLLLAGAIAGIAENFGMCFALRAANDTLLAGSLVALLIAVSVYDWWAVRKSGIMVSGFRRLTDHGVFFMFILPRSVADAWMHLREVRRDGHCLFLGTGDSALPALFLVGIRHMGVASLAGAFLGMLAGIAFDFLALSSQKNSVPLPALPRIVLGMIGGFLFGFLLHAVRLS